MLDPLLHFSHTIIVIYAIIILVFYIILGLILPTGWSIIIIILRWLLCLHLCNVLIVIVPILLLFLL